MTQPNEGMLAYLKTLKGRRVECVRMEDADPVAHGTQGEIIFVDSLGTLHVKWDNGRSLGLAYGVDQYRVLD